MTLSSAQLARWIRISPIKSLSRTFVRNQLTDIQFDECMKQVFSRPSMPPEEHLPHTVSKMNSYQQSWVRIMGHK
jgi:hypothetical protein